MQIRSSDNSIIVVEEASCSWDLKVPVLQTENRLIYGGVVTWVEDYNFHVTAAGYYIGDVFYESPAADITLSPADPSLDRIDVIYVDADGIVKVKEGTPSITPSQPGLDLGLEIGLGVVLVEAGSTEPLELVQECIDDEVLGWTPTATDVAIDPASANTPCNGLVVAEATGASDGDALIFTRNTPFSPTATYNVLKLQIKPKSDWSTDLSDNHSLKIQFRLAGVNVGAEVTVENGVLFDPTDLTCQTIAISMINFGIPVTSQVDNIKITVESSNGTFGWFIDALCLQGGVFAAEEGDFIWNQYFGPQTPGRYWIRGNARADGWFTSPQRIGTTENFYIGTEKFGWGSSADNNSATVVGFLATGGGNNGSVAIGSQAIADNAIAIGWGVVGNTGEVSIGGVSGSFGSTLVGLGSVSTGLSGVSLGANTTIGNNGAIAIGYASTSNGLLSSAIGRDSEATHDYSGVFGAFGKTTTTRQLVFGGDDTFVDYGFTSLYFGTGVTSTFNADRFWTITGSEGADIAGNKWTFAAARATGDAVGGTFEWQTSDAGSSGSTLQSLTTKMALDSNTKGLYLTDVRFQQDRGTDTAAANNLVLPYDGTGFVITGNTQITAIDTTDWQPGSIIYLVFTGSPTLKHDTAGAAGTLRLKLSGSIDFVAAANDLIAFWNSGSNWHEIGRKLAATGSVGILSGDNALSLSTATNLQWGGLLLHDTVVYGDNLYSTAFVDLVNFDAFGSGYLNLYSDGGANYSSLMMDNTAPQNKMMLDTQSANQYSYLLHAELGASSYLELLTNKKLSLVSSLGTIVSNRLSLDEAASVAAANNLTIGYGGNAVTITGNTQINAITTTDWEDGAVIYLHLTGTPTLKHNTAGGANTAPLRLAGAVDFTVTGYTVLELQLKDNFWNEIGRTQASGGGLLGITADSGVTASSPSNVQLGQTVGAGGDPGALLHHTEIPSANFTLSFNATALQTNNILQSKNAAAAIRARITKDASFSNTGGQTGSEIFGDLATVTGQNAVVIGNSATAVEQCVVIGRGASSASAGSDVVIGQSASRGAGNPGSVIIGSGNTSTGTGGNNVIIGTGSSSTGSGGVVVGYASLLNGINGIAIGNQASTGHTYSQVYGALASSTANNQVIFGGNLVGGYAGVKDFYFGSGVQNIVGGIIDDVTFNVTASLGTNIAGKNFYINASKATGDAVGGSTIFQTSDPGASGTTLQTLSPKITLNANGETELNKYGVGNFTSGTGAYLIAVKADGSLMEYPTGGLVGGSLITADNGLNSNSANNVRLGGTLVQNTTIDTTASYRLNIQSGNLSNPALYVLNASGSALGDAIWAISSDGIGIYAQSNSKYPIYGLITSTDQSAVLEILKLDRQSSGSPGLAGIGQSIGMYNNTSTTAGVLSNQIVSKFAVPTHGSQTSELQINGVTGGATETWLTLGKSGYLQLRSMTATEASAITPAAGMMVFVNNTNGTFTSVGFWGYDGSAWAKF